MKTIATPTFKTSRVTTNPGAVPIAMEPRGLLSFAVSHYYCLIRYEMLQLCLERPHSACLSIFRSQVPIGIFNDTLPYRDSLSRARIKVH